MSSNDYPETKLPLRVQAAMALSAGLLLAAGYALHPLWWAPWLAPALLVPATGGGRGRAWLMGALAGAVSVVSVIGYYLDFSAITAVIVLVLRTLAWGGAAALARSAWRRLPAGSAVFVLPVFIAALEEITLTVSVHGAVGSLAYSQMPLLPVIQTASFGGTPAVTFLVLLPGSLIGGLLLRRPRARPALAAIGLAAAVLSACAAYASWRLTAPAPAGRQSVALIASDRFHGIPEDWKAVWAVYRPAIDRAATPGALVVLPEKIALLDGPAAAAAAASDIRAAAAKTRTTLVVGLEVHDASVYRNRALVARPDGTLNWYDKQRMVPVFEDRDVPGHSPLVLNAGPLTLGTAICKDMHIPSIGREYAGKAALIGVPAWDFGRDGWMGARMTGMRGIEGGYAIARSARNGLAGAYDAYGRVVAEAPSGPQTTVAAELAAARVDTPYAYIGEAFGWMCAAFSLGLIAWLLVDRKRA